MVIWSTPVVLVKKKNRTTRLCVDYRNLNNITIKDALLLPKIDDSFNKRSGTKYFSTLDLYAGYWQVNMADKDKPKTAFVTKKDYTASKSCHFGSAMPPQHSKGSS